MPTKLKKPADVWFRMPTSLYDFIEMLPNDEVDELLVYLDSNPDVVKDMIELLVDTHRYKTKNTVKNVPKKLIPKKYRQNRKLTTLLELADK